MAVCICDCSSRICTDIAVMQVGKVRLIHDGGALVVHGVALLLTIADKDFFWKTDQGILLVVTELIALVAHLYYLLYSPYNFLKYRSINDAIDNAEWNEGKWLEYSFSATTGTLATFVSGGQATTPYIVVIVLLGLVQQSYIGKAIDDLNTKRPIEELWLLCLIAWCIQVFEFAVVGTFNAQLGVFLIYIFAWSSFGLLATWQLYQRRNKLNEEQKQRLVQITESWYSFLSYLAKLSVFAAVWAASRPNRYNWLVGIAVVGSFAVVTQAVMMKTAR